MKSGSFFVALCSESVKRWFLCCDPLLCITHFCINQAGCTSHLPNFFPLSFSCCMSWFCFPNWVYLPCFCSVLLCITSAAALLWMCVPVRAFCHIRVIFSCFLVPRNSFVCPPGADGPRPMAIFELLDYIVNEVCLVREETCFDLQQTHSYIMYNHEKKKLMNRNQNWNAALDSAQAFVE